MVIRFDRPDVPYEQALYTAVSKALDRRPSAKFDIVAVTPTAGSAAQVALNTNAAKRNAADVFESLVDMGLPGERMDVSAMTKASAKANEVHVYVH